MHPGAAIALGFFIDEDCHPPLIPAQAGIQLCTE